MTIRNLDFLLKPTSVAVIGASRRANTVGAVVARNLFHAGFGGPIMPVHPRECSIEGVLAYPSVADLPLTPDLALICTPPDTVPGLIDALGRRGTKAVVVVTAGFGEFGTEGERLQQKLLDAAKPHLLRVLGPNCVGLLIPGIGLNASFAHVAALKGDVALVAQSGAVVTALLDWAAARKIGFSHMISVGDMADVDFGDLLDYLAADGSVRAILLYAEALTHARKFMSAARAAARQKPVIVIKAGRSDEAAKAARSHTGALAGADDVYDAAFRRAGVLRVHDLDELFDAVETLSLGTSATSFAQCMRGRLAIITNGGGIGVMATDSLIEDGGKLAELSPDTVEKLDAVLPKTWSRGNPVDIIGDANAKRYAEALKVVLDDRNTDAILVLNCPSAVGDSLWAAQSVAETVDAQKAGRRRPVLTSWLGEGTAADARRLFAAHRLPTYHTPGDAIRGFMHLVRYYRNQELLMETPASVSDAYETQTNTARDLIDGVMRDGREWLTEYEAKKLIAAYGVPAVDTRHAADPDAAAEAARAIGGSVALKISSPDLTHKSDIGGVVLRLNDPERVRAEAIRMLGRIRLIAPDARLDGFTVQKMANRSEPHELIVGMTEDRLFGPVLLFGQGGTGVEVLADKALALPPLNLTLARDAMARTRIWNLLRGYRARKPAAIDEIAATLIKISQLVIDFPEIVELDINPLLADGDGVLALDARVKVGIPSLPGARRLAIRPYPKSLEEEVQLRDGRAFLLRPVRPEDEPALLRLVDRLTPEDIRLRFFAPMKHLSHKMAARLTQIDYDREMALVAVDQSAGTDGGELRGVVRISADPDNVRAEYAVVVQSDMKGMGLGSLLMRKILDHARTRGLSEIFGEVLRENTGMLALCQRLGFTRQEHPDEPSIVEVRLTL